MGGDTEGDAQRGSAGASGDSVLLPPDLAPLLTPSAEAQVTWGLDACLALLQLAGDLACLPSHPGTGVPGWAVPPAPLALW